MFPRAWRVATLGGVDVRVDPSLLIMVGLVTWSFFQRFDGPRGTATALTMAAIGALLFFLSVLVHELAHAWEARSRDIEVGGITLFLLGGVTEAHLDATRARDEFAMAAVGPYASLVAAAVFGLTAAGIDEFVPSLHAVAEVAGLLGWINVGLAIFNLLPGAPLDGGRVLRSLIWGATGDRGRGVRWSAVAGGLLAVAVLGYGLYGLLAQADTFGGLWLLLIGWFMLRAARAEYAQERASEVFDGATLGSVLEADRGASPAVVDVDEPLQQVMTRLLPEGAGAAAMVTRDGVPVGVLTLEDVGDVEAPDREFRTASDVMTLLEDVPEVDADLPLLDTLRHNSGHGAMRVVRDGHDVGVLTPDRVGRWLATRRGTDT